MSPRGFRCSWAARERGDSLIATAPPARRWLLIEREGAWPTHAMNIFPQAEARLLSEKAAREAARISLVRRPHRHPASDGPFRWAIADVRRGREGIRWHMADSIAEVVAAPWDVTAGEGNSVALVCCHSKHDVCCALRGRPVAAALDEVWPGRVWECSHLGGDRFAATMVVLPTGLCYGRLDEESGAAALAAHDTDELLVEHLRGRCVDSREEQAATTLALRAHLAPPRIGALQPVGDVDHQDGVTTVRFSRPDLAVAFQEREVELGTPSTCRSTGNARGREYGLVGAKAL